MSEINQEENVGIDDLLDATLDDLADMPEFKPFPAGAHRCTISWEIKKVSDIPSIELKLKAIETMELANPEDTPVAKDDSTNTLFMLKKKDGNKNELGEGQWKALLKPLQEHFGTASNRETMEASNGAECIVVTSIRKDKDFKNNGKIYTSVTSIGVV